MNPNAKLSEHEILLKMNQYVEQCSFSVKNIEFSALNRPSGQCFQQSERNKIAENFIVPNDVVYDECTYFAKSKNGFPDRSIKRTLLPNWKMNNALNG